MPVKGKLTSPDVVKNIRDELSDMSFGIARKYNVLVNYPKMHIEGTKVVLGPASILLPNLTYTGLEGLKQIELKKQKKKG